MRRIKLIVAYDGTNYCGWQVQPNGITVQEVLNQALSDLFAKKTASGRYPYSGIIRSAAGLSPAFYRNS